MKIPALNADFLFRAGLTRATRLWIFATAAALVPEGKRLFLRLAERVDQQAETLSGGEQQILDIADRAYVLQNGRVALSGTSAEIAADDGVRRAYLGI